MVNRIAAQDSSNTISLKLLTKFNSVLLSLNPTKLINYMTLIEAILADERINPVVQTFFFFLVIQTIFSQNNLATDRCTLSNVE